MPKVLLTGGGTAGHVTPNIALLPYLKKAGCEVEYIGSYDGIEKELIEKEGIPYTGIDSGKLRRYLSAKNISDLFHIQKGLHEARHYIKESRPDVVFSKGGFVTVPVVEAAREQHIPVVIHESDLSPGLANRLSIPAASVICYNFPETEKYLSDSRITGKIIHTGLPVRDELFTGSAQKGRALCGFDDDRPVLLVMGGSLGAVNVNNAVWEGLEGLLERFQVAHICGKGKTDAGISHPGYVQFEYVNEDLKDLMAACDLMISRAGANAVWEIAALHKPALLIPLGSEASRGDQILNANSFKNLGYSEVITEDGLTGASLDSAVFDLWENRESYIEAMKKAGAGGAAERVAKIIIDQISAKKQ